MRAWVVPALPNVAVAVHPRLPPRWARRSPFRGKQRDLVTALPMLPPTRIVRWVVLPVGHDGWRHTVSGRLSRQQARGGCPVPSHRKGHVDRSTEGRAPDLRRRCLTTAWRRPLALPRTSPRPPWAVGALIRRAHPRGFGVPSGSSQALTATAAMLRAPGVVPEFTLRHVRGFSRFVAQPNAATVVGSSICGREERT